MTPLNSDRPLNANISLKVALVPSFVIHAALGVGLAFWARPEIPPQKAFEPVSVKIVETPRPVTPPQPLKPRERPIKSNRSKVANKPSATPPPPIQGLTKESLDPNSKSNFVAPVGNTLMVADQGIRKADVEDLPTTDLSQRARLLSFEKPTYTAEAVDAGLEGRYVLDVFVDETGVVKEAELRKKVGYGMDDLLVQSALQAKFSPRLDKMGQALSGWDEIVVNLVIP